MATVKQRVVRSWLEFRTPSAPPHEDKAVLFVDGQRFILSYNNETDEVMLVKQPADPGEIGEIVYSEMLGEVR